MARFTQPWAAFDGRTGLPSHGHQAQIGRGLLGRTERMVMQDGQHVVADVWPNCRDTGKQATVFLEVWVVVDMLVDIQL